MIMTYMVLWADQILVGSIRISDPVARNHCGHVYDKHLLDILFRIQMALKEEIKS